MNIKHYITMLGLGLTLGLTSARANPPQPNEQGQICLPPDQLEKVCRENYCPPAPHCPSKVAQPRIPRSKCEDHYASTPGVVGVCLHDDDVERLSKLEGLVVERGPDNLCPWGGSYHCEALSTQKVTEYVNRPVDRVVKERVEVKVNDPATQQALEEARKRITELLARKPTITYTPTLQKPENELSVDLAGLAHLTADGKTPVFNMRLGYHHALGEYFILGVEGMFLQDKSSTERSTSPGQELLPDGNTKSWTDVTSADRNGFFGGVGGVLGVRVPFPVLDSGIQFYGEASTALYALFGEVSGDKERTTYVYLPDGTTLKGPKTISEPRPHDVERMLGVLANVGIGMRVPLGSDPSAPTFLVNVGAEYLLVREKDNSHYIGGKAGFGFEF